ncbi:flagellin [Methylobacterium sp. 37f]|uniref:flagellin N-terminal helical domain-containing protein n=1 Tax=Methylobacterium sp. 37f TaxID=2817058 RepID=UPI0024947747|nr:flagellin [Methylobacterium sp. 37f]MCK2053233.1 flagellin [Methylobacterium sp. 37f]
MTSLLTNNAAMTALTTLKSINTQLDMTSNRVSTGQRVSNASDNAAYWSIATTVRTDNASLSAVKDSLGLGSSAVDTAYNGLNSIITDLQNMRAKLQTALQPGVDRSKVQTEITAIQNKMKATADSSNSSGQNWLSVNSATSNTAYQPIQNVVAGFSRDPSGAINFSKVNVDVNNIKLFDANSTSVTTTATKAVVSAANSLTGTAAFVRGGTADFSGTAESAIKITIGGVNDTIKLNKETLASAAADLTKVTTEEFLSALNNQIAASANLAGKVKADLDTQGRLTFTSTATGGATKMTIEAGTVTGGKALVDVGYGLAAATDLAAPSVTGGAYTAFDLSGTNTKVLTINDGYGAKTVTLNAASFTALGAAATSGANTAVNGADVAAMINKQLADQGSKATVTFAATKFTVATPEKGSLNSAGTANTITLGGADVAGFGLTAGATTGTDLVSASLVRVGYGTDAGTTVARGILDSIDNATSVSVANVDISQMVGTSGDTALSALITQVDKAIAKVTDSGTKLGANKTQIDGQKTFVDTLMKANDRTIGILVDADIEEESTKLKALQTQQQLAVQSLSIANSSSQGILSLFR